MIGEYKLEHTEDDDTDPLYPLSELQQKVARRHQVFPIDSCRAYATLVDDAGVHHRVLHRTFIFRMNGKKTVEKVRTICNAMWAQLCERFPEGSVVVWRVRPTIEEQDVTETCEACGQSIHDPKFYTYGRMRIGCLGRESPTLGELYQDGMVVPTLTLKDT
jgi:hypothetical protein